MSELRAAVAPEYVPDATYRLQFNSEFTFADAEALVDYLAKLGVSDIYASPFLKARAGSTHGYDITDHRKLNHEIGDRDALASLTGRLRSRSMGLIADFVPNHMGIGRADNPWWLDMLEYGQSSPFAEYFDIDFYPAKPELRGKVLLPVLGDRYGLVLEDGQLQPKLDTTEASFSVWYWDHRFPLSPFSYGRVFTAIAPRLRNSGLPEAALDALDCIAAGFREIGRAVRSARARAARRHKAQTLKSRFASIFTEHEGLADAVKAALEDFQGAPGDPPSFLPLHRLLEAQHYRLAFWRTASDEINYRRFFQINDLAGLRVEVPAVFDAAHALILELLAEGHIRGVRIDHIDGLLDPKAYLERLQEKSRKARNGDRDVYVVVEKILGHHERLRNEWRCSGTTGYDALNDINGLFVDPSAQTELTETHRRFTSEPTEFEEIVKAGKREVMQVELASEVQVLVNGLKRLSERDWRTRDYTLRDIRLALEEVIVCFPVYRTYIDRRRPAAEDLQDIDWAIAQARKHPRFQDDSIFDYIWGILTTDSGRRRGDPFPGAEVRRLAYKAQQVTSPVMAKGLEDTAFYRFNRLISLNEVGGHPEQFGIPLTAFHRRMAERAEHWPHSMIASATHDTKRGEDVRARINVISEVCGEWSERIARWSSLNAWRKSNIDGVAVPSANDEYLFYQTLVGCWPPDLKLNDGMAAPSAQSAFDALRVRLETYMLKVVREAKLHSSWTRKNAAYEQGIVSWLGSVLDVSNRNPFLVDFAVFQRHIARVGVVNSLAQTALKLTCPGVPDIYQGCELFELSLVDPDNRRPVDFFARRDLLRDLESTFKRSNDAGPAVRSLLDNWPDSRIKLLLVWRLLSLRQRWPALFSQGEYRPLATVGTHADRVLAFMRCQGNQKLVVVLPRLVAPLMPGEDDWPIGPSWADTAVSGIEAGHYYDVLTSEPVTVGEPLAMEKLLKFIPVAALVSDSHAPDRLVS